MPYYTISDFAAGLDLRRSILTAPAGTLRVLRNCHITPGGEIEKRYAFVKIADVDPASKGLVEVNGNLYVFAAGLNPARIMGTVHNLVLNQAYTFSVGSTFTVSDGVTTTKLTLKASQTPQDFINVVNNNASLLIRAKFIVYTAATGTTPAAGALLLETMSDTPVIIGGTIAPAELAQLGLVAGTTPGDENIFDPADEWSVGTLKLEVPTLYSIVDYDLFDNQVYVVAQIDADPANIMHCYNGISVPDATGRYVRTYKTKIFGLDGAVLSFSSVGDPTDWTGTGSGLIDLSLEDSDMSSGRALEVYYDKLAIFSGTACQLWLIDPDPLKTQYSQTLRQAGTVAPQSVLSYGSGDVLYVAPDGIRSLRARNASLAASVSDVGSPLDPIMQELFREQGEDFMNRIIAVLQPVTGRFWVVLPDRVYVLSAFPGPKITAWSEYIPSDVDGNEFSITAVCTHRQHIIVRDDNNQIFAYGGGEDTGVVIDASPVEVVFPFLAGTKTATEKTYHGIDAACQGEWEVYAAYNPYDENAEDYIGKLIGPSFMQGRLAMEGRSTHISMRLRSAVPGPLVLSNLVLHYDFAEQT